MRTGASHPDAEKIAPVLKLPPDLAIEALRILCVEKTEAKRRARIAALRPDIPDRTLRNAYVIPSLNELGLFDGSLRHGSVTRYGEAIATADEADARTLMAKYLMEFDFRRVGFLDWLADRSISGEGKRVALRRFARDKGIADEALTSALDRLSKWVNYLVAFGVIQESQTDEAVTWIANRRHLAALASGTAAAAVPVQSRREALLSAYANVSRRRGTRLYLPIADIRAEVGRFLQDEKAVLLTDGAIDEILQAAPSILEKHRVTFSPFSGPSRGGLQLKDIYAGYISVRPRSGSKDDD